MSRFRRAVHGVATSYMLLAATALYSLASLPLAFHYLDTKHFGLWAVMGTLVGYLRLIDAGMTGAAARLLIDYKDDRNGGHYGGLIKTGWLVFCLQGAIIFAVGIFLAGFLAGLLGIHGDLKPEFIRLVNWQCGNVGFLFATSMLNLILSGHQRMDLNNYIGAGGLALNFTAQWIFFHFQCGVLSLAYGGITATLGCVICQTIVCSRLRLFPDPGGWGRVTWRHFREIFDFGKDLFLVSLGTQLILTSQTIIITRMLGVEVAGIWSVGIRMFNLLNQVIWRLYDMSNSAFAEMLARGEMNRLYDRYRSLAILTFSLAGWLAVSFVLCNSLFAPFLSHGKVHWPPGNDLLLAIWMILLAMVHCHNSFILLTKKVEFMRYIYFLEGSAFVIASLLVARWGGLPAIIVCSIVCTTLFSCTYGIRRVCRMFQVPLVEVAFRWLRPMLKVLLFYLPVAGLVWWSSLDALPIIRLVIHALVAGSLGAFLFLRFGIPGSFQEELLRRVPARVAPCLKWIFLQPTA